MCQRSELLASVSRVSPDSGYVPVTVFGRTLYLREGAPYVPGDGATVQTAPERFNKTKFIQCFLSAIAFVQRVADSACELMPQYPQCAAIANSAGTAIAAIGCAIYASVSK